MPPRILPKRDPRITRITRADARANAAVQAAVNTTALASRGLAELPTAEETAAIEASVVDDRNNRPPPSSKPKRKHKKPTKVTKGQNGPKKKESKKEKFVRRQKEKAEAAKKAEEAEEAKAIEDVEAAKAIAAVDAAKAAEAAEAAKAAKENGGEGGPVDNGISSSEEIIKSSDDGKKGGQGGPIENDTSSSEEIIESSDDGKKGKTTKNNPREGGGPREPYIGVDPTGGRSVGRSPKISGTELSRRLEGVDWAKLGEKLKSELFNFVRAGGSVEEWEKKRAEKEQLEKLTEQIGFVSSEEEILEGDSENDNDEYEDLKCETDPEAEEIVEEGDIEDENDVYENPKGGETGPAAKVDAGYVGKVIHCPGSRRSSETEEDDGYDPELVTCCGWCSNAENGNETETESDPGSENAHTHHGGSNTKSPVADAKKSARKTLAEKKRKFEDSSEQNPKKKAKLGDDSGGEGIRCSWRRDYSSNRGDIGARKPQLQDSLKTKNSSRTKSKGDELPEANPSKRGKRGVKIIIPPKRRRSDDGIICALPGHTPKKSLLKKHKRNNSAEKKTSKRSLPDEEPERSKEGGRKKVGWLW
ncbi:hypothetical protein V498_01656 [Pseudogymnoascus sp. VKM F-4517 (FW-2822)]|nr:hypothetical protein V498_01656 [Pseudogymnoascus sp. VKM F-4517 (FW-2822)]